MDTGALKKAQPETIRILVWLLSFLGFGYSTAEFEVTSERLGVYRPEEHIEWDFLQDTNPSTDSLPAIPKITMTTKTLGNMTSAYEVLSVTLNCKSTWKPE